MAAARYQILIGIAPSVAAFFAPDKPPQVFISLICGIHCLSAAAVADLWSTICIAIFWTGGAIVGAAIVAGPSAAKLKQKSLFENEVKAVIARRNEEIHELRATISNYVQANSEWQAAYQTAQEEIALLKDHYLRALAEADSNREHFRALADEQIKLISQDRNWLAAENAELKRSLAQMCALPERYMNILKQVVCHSLVVKAVLVVLHPDRAKDGDPRQRLLRNEMTQRFTELKEYVQSH